MEKLIEQLLEEIGEDPQREGLQDTPRRVAESMKFLTSGYSMNLEEIVNGAIFTDEENNSMVICKDIELYSLCEHHMLPFVGKAHVAYIPNGKIIGISKIPRIVDYFARRLQVQEGLTNLVAQTLNRTLKPLGVGVVIEAQHLCMMMRGVGKQNSKMVTSTMLGGFKTRSETRSEFLQLISHLD